MTNRSESNQQKRYEEIIAELIQIRTEQAFLPEIELGKKQTVRNYSKRVSELMFELLAINSSRHQTTGSDVEFLTSLEYKYMRSVSDEDNLLKVANIIIGVDYIEIAGIKICRRDEINIFTGLVRGTFYDRESGITYFSQKAIGDYLGRTPGLGVLTNEDWIMIIKSIPGNNDFEKIENLRRILNLKLSGTIITGFDYEDEDGESVNGDIIHGIGKYGIYWSASNLNMPPNNCFYFEQDSAFVTPVDISSYISYIPLRCKFI